MIWQPYYCNKMPTKRKQKKLPISDDVAVALAVGVITECVKQKLDELYDELLDRTFGKKQDEQTP